MKSNVKSMHLLITFHDKEGVYQAVLSKNQLNAIEWALATTFEKINVLDEPIETIEIKHIP